MRWRCGTCCSGASPCRIDGSRLDATLWGEPVDVARHAPACEPKGATYTALRVAKDIDGRWLAACVVECMRRSVMDPARFTRVDATTWRIEPHGAMRVPAVIYADEALIRDMDDKVYEQAANVATLPGIVQASYAMPDAHWGYGFPIGGVAAFDPDQGGIVSAGGVGFDISCGVRTMLTGLSVADVRAGPKGARGLAVSSDPGRRRQQRGDHARCRSTWMPC